MTTPRKSLPPATAGALVPPLPEAVRAELAAIGGDGFAAAMSAEVWPLAVTLLEGFRDRDSTEQRRAWLLQALGNFQAVARARADQREQLRESALLYFRRLPDELQLIYAAPADAAPAAEWCKALKCALRHPAVLRSNRKGPLAECSTFAVIAARLLDANGLRMQQRERREAVRALALIGNTAANQCGLPAFGAAHWRRALSAARAAKSSAVEVVDLPAGNLVN